MPKHLPSLSKLRAFEAAARHLNFTRAALELNLTQTAISHQISSLEELIGQKLFLRDRNTLRLTQNAREYLTEVRMAVAALSVATDRVMDANKDKILTIACLSTFGMKCLSPLLWDFRAKFPHYSLRVRTIMSFDKVTRHDYDVAIIYDATPWPGYHVRYLGSEKIFPVCSPALLKKGPPLKTPEDLSRHTLIRTESLILRDEWPAWLDRAGVPGLVFSDEIIFDLLFPSLQGAVDSLGVIMGRVPLVQAELDAGRLVAPFDIEVESASSWYAVALPDAVSIPKVRNFLDWASDQLAFGPSLENVRQLAVS